MADDKKEIQYEVNVGGGKSKWTWWIVGASFVIAALFLWALEYGVG